MNKKTKIILISSLILNIIFISFHLGYTIKSHTVGGFLRYREKQIIAVLPSDKQILVKEGFEKIAAMRAENLSHNKNNLSEIEKIATAENFNEKLFLEKTRQFRKLNDKSRENCDEQAAKILSKLDQNERKKVVEQFKKSMKGFFKK